MWDKLDLIYRRFVEDRGGLMLALMFFYLNTIIALSIKAYLNFMVFWVSAMGFFVFSQLRQKRKVNDWLLRLVYCFIAAGYLTAVIGRDNFTMGMLNNLDDMLSHFVGVAMLAMGPGIALDAMKIRKKYEWVTMVSILAAMILYMVSLGDGSRDGWLYIGLINLGKLVAAPLPIFVIKKLVVG